MSQDDDVREQIDRLEAVKDFIIGFLEGAATPDPRTRALWEEDAREAFFDVVAAYDMLRTPGAEDKGKDRPASAMSFLEMARGSVKQVSSELRTYKTDVAADLISKLEEAFDGAWTAISASAGVPPKGQAPAGATRTVLKLGDDDYTLSCAACGKVAAVFRVEVHEALDDRREGDTLRGDYQVHPP